MEPKGYIFIETSDDDQANMRYKVCIYDQLVLYNLTCTSDSARRYFIYRRETAHAATVQKALQHYMNNPSEEYYTINSDDLIDIIDHLEVIN
jgi:hypothetical protein